MADVAAGRLGTGALDGLQQAFAAAKLPTYLTDARWRVTTVSAGLLELVGRDAAEAIGSTPAELLAPHDGATGAAAIVDRLRRGEAVTGDAQLTRADGRRVWARTMDSPILDAAGALTGAVGLVIDITEAKVHEALHRAVLEPLVNDEPIAVVMDLLCREVESFAPEVIVSVLGVTGDGRLEPLAAPRLPAWYMQALDGNPIGPKAGSCGTAAYRGEKVVVTDVESDELWDDYRDLVAPLGLHSCWSYPITSGTGAVLGTFAFYSAERRGPDAFHEYLVSVATYLCALALETDRSRRDLRQLSFYDAVTGLANRSLMTAHAERLLREADRERSGLAVLFLDVDHFTSVNDALGHGHGDDLLRVLADRLREHVPEPGLLGRLSGDEFVVLLPRREGRQVADTVERLRAALSAPLEISGVTLSPMLSIGISVYPHDGTTFEVLLRCAGLAMYQAKRTGRGGFNFYRSEMNVVARERLTLETSLREDLARRRLDLVYQPLVHLRDGGLYGVEALARWHHAELGDIPPQRFVTLAEESGLITELTTWALRTACGQLAAWREAGIPVPSVSVNLSPVDFLDAGLTALVLGCVAENGLAPKDLVLEITESVLLENTPLVLHTLQDLHATGVGLAIDDFGTGYSSLGYLRRLPLRVLKVDKSLTADVAVDAAQRALSLSVVGLGRALGLTVVAEGIEHAAQRDVLAGQGYQVGQGYLFSRPLPADGLAGWLTERQEAVR